MKINNRTYSGPNVVEVVLPRPEIYEDVLDDQGEPLLDSDGVKQRKVVVQDIIFKARAVLDFDEFDQLVKAPEPMVDIFPGGRKVPNTKHPKYLAALTAYSTKRMNWIILKSLEVTDGLEWDTVKMDDPETWDKYQEDFKSAGISIAEVNLIIQAVLQANSMDETKLEEARNRFLAMKGQPSNGQSTSPSIAR